MSRTDISSDVRSIVRLSRRAHDPAGSDQEARDVSFLCNAFYSVERFAADHSFSCTFTKYAPPPLDEDDASDTATASAAPGATYHLSCVFKDTRDPQARLQNPVRSTRDITAMLREHIKSFICTTQPAARTRTRSSSSRLLRDVLVHYNGRAQSYTVELQLATPAPTPAIQRAQRGARKRRLEEDDASTKKRKVHPIERLSAHAYAELYDRKFHLFVFPEKTKT